MLDEFAVAVDVGVQMAELPEQGSRAFRVARVEFTQLGVEQVVEEQRTVFGTVGGRYVGDELRQDRERELGVGQAAPGVELGTGDLRIVLGQVEAAVRREATEEDVAELGAVS